MNVKPKKSETLYLSAKPKKQDKQILLMVEKLTIVNGLDEILLNEIFNSEEEIDKVKNKLNSIFQKAVCIVVFEQSVFGKIIPYLSKENIQKFRLGQSAAPKVKSASKFRQPETVYVEEEDDDDDDTQVKAIAESCQQRFSILCGDYNRKGECRRKSLEEALEYYGLSFENKDESLLSETSAFKSVWETMYPDFYSDVPKN
jgi:hypothetical protein